VKCQAIVQRPTENLKLFPNCMRWTSYYRWLFSDTFYLWGNTRIATLFDQFRISFILYKELLIFG